MFEPTITPPMKKRPRQEPRAEYNAFGSNESWRQQAIVRLKSISRKEWLQDEVFRMIGNRYMNFGPLEADTMRFLQELPVQLQHESVGKSFEAALLDEANFEETLLAHVTSCGDPSKMQESLEDGWKTPDEEEEPQDGRDPGFGMTMGSDQTQPRPCNKPSVAPGRRPISGKQVAMAPPIETTILVPVPRQLIAKIIGKKAATLRRIIQDSGAEIDARNQQTDPVQVRVRGYAENVQKAKEMIKELVDSGTNRHANSEVVEVPLDKIGLVMGEKGSQVNRIQKDTGTKIDVDFKIDPCKVYISGSEENVMEAKYSVLAIAGILGDQESMVLDLPLWAAGAIMGKGGSRLRNVQGKTNTVIEVRKDAWMCHVQLSGSSEDIVNAADMINQIVEEEKY
mmetsp:Transcript_22419/g.34813  ORF Transcript_22419/g.34813 Transcript_22419/m.34813 type:complete len:396 (+) Transcript_22419:53-1240(+)